MAKLGFTEPLEIQQQIVIVLDTSANNAIHYQLIFREYIVPLLNSFREHKDNPKPSEYALVTFRDYPPFADYVVQASPWYSYERLMAQLKSPSFSGGGFLTNALADALCTARRKCIERPTPKKYILLVSSSLPHDLPCRCCVDGLNAIDQARRIGTDNISLSLIAPHLLEPLKRLYHSAVQSPQLDYSLSASMTQPDPPSQTQAHKNYHIVFLRNLTIPATSTAGRSDDVQMTSASAPSSAVAAAPAGASMIVAPSAATSARQKKVLWDGMVVFPSVPPKPPLPALRIVIATEKNEIPPLTLSAEGGGTLTAVGYLPHRDVSTALQKHPIQQVEIHSHPKQAPKGAQDFTAVANRMKDEAMWAFFEAPNGRWLLLSALRPPGLTGYLAMSLPQPLLTQLSNVKYAQTLTPNMIPPSSTPTTISTSFPTPHMAAFGNQPRKF